MAEPPEEGIGRPRNFPVRLAPELLMRFDDLREDDETNAQAFARIVRIAEESRRPRTADATVDPSGVAADRDSTEGGPAGKEGAGSPLGVVGGLAGKPLAGKLPAVSPGPILAPSGIGYTEDAESETQADSEGRKRRRAKEFEGWEEFVPILGKIPNEPYSNAREAVLQYLSLHPEGTRGAFGHDGLSATSPTINDLLFERDTRFRLEPPERGRLLEIPGKIARSFYLNITIEGGNGLSLVEGYR
jgi:hypothetical protein